MIHFFYGLQENYLDITDTVLQRMRELDAAGK